ENGLRRMKVGKGFLAKNGEDGGKGWMERNATLAATSGLHMVERTGSESFNGLL
ncbi:hypothetical protein HAX54_051831, partial [Datura stramonium]|nr:hypothetical protein [Datura stramonium]